MRTSWIWTQRPVAERNAFVRFRRRFEFQADEDGAEVSLRITADSRYWLWVNGRRIGAGPVRAWPRHWKFDEFDIGPYLHRGRNVLAVLVNHLGEGTFQYLPADPGLWAEVRTGRRVIFRTDTSWRAAPDAANRSNTPRISVQEGFEEQFDARREDEWREPEFRDGGWRRAVIVPPPHPPPRPHGLPALTEEPVFPVRVVRAEVVEPVDWCWNLELRPYFAPKDVSSRLGFVRGFVWTRVWSPARQTVRFARLHQTATPFRLNDRIVTPRADAAAQLQALPFRKGWNTMVLPFTADRGESWDGIKPPGAFHGTRCALVFDSPKPLKFASRGSDGGSPWAFVGPFEFPADVRASIEAHMDHPNLILPERIAPGATVERYDAVFSGAESATEVQRREWFQELAGGDALTGDVFASAYCECGVRAAELSRAEALLSDNGAWCVIHPEPDGLPTRVLLDFGKEVVAFHEFEIDAAAGTVLDFHNFEFIQRDGRENYAEGMNNTFRYVCRDGRQHYRTLQRRGFQYSWLIVRKAAGPVRIRRIAAVFSTYPQANRGRFECGDAMLNTIWRTGAHTLRCCMEDTYTDCPSYEQVHWVGDAWAESLIDWTINGDPRLWRHCLEQTAHSLEHAPVTLSHVPSAWPNILPAWSFLWMRSCRNHLLWTGDFDGARRLFPWICRNVRGLRGFLTDHGLLRIRGWNMFDWAEMDTPADGIVTHINAFAVLALRECAELADWLKKGKAAAEFRELASGIQRAINRELWDRNASAYVDCIHTDGRRSAVFSQQTQTVTLISGVATGRRAKRCADLVEHPPEGFVKAGSPFFEFFLLEHLASSGRTTEFLDLIRRDWGFMIDMGATTFWEMWSLTSGRLTRSHCHGWSAAPTYYLSSFVLGIEPVMPGFAEIRFRPRLGDLPWAYGTLPTPKGPIRVELKRSRGGIEKTIHVPKGIRIRE